MFLNEIIKAQISQKNQIIKCFDHFVLIFFMDKSNTKAKNVSWIQKTFNLISRNIPRSHTVFSTTHAALDAAPMAYFKRRIQP